MPKKSKQDNNKPEGIHLLNWVDEQFMNVGGKKAKDITHKLTQMLTEDGVWTLKHISQTDAVALCVLLEDFAESGKRPKFDKPNKGVRI